LIAYAILLPMAPRHPAVLALAAVMSLKSGFALARESSASGAPSSSGASKPSTRVNATASSSDTGMANAGAATVPPVTPVEKKAARLSNEALGVDFSAGRFKISEKKLREAIRICKPEVCSTSFQARLHRDLGFVYVTALERVDDGKDEFAIALNLDPTVVLPFLQQTGAATKAFADVKARLARGEILPKPAPVVTPKEEPAPVVTPKAATTPKVAPKVASKPKAAPKAANTSKAVIAEEITLEEAPEAEPSPKGEAATEQKAPPSKSSDAASSDASGDNTPGGRVVNWLTLSLQQNLVIHSSTPGACSAGSQYECFALGQRTTLGTADFTPGGNQISGTTILPGTFRVLLGYERVVFPDESVGIRVGSVLYGKGQRMTTDPSFLYFHVEGRVTLWMGQDVFSKAGLRPYVYVNGGLAEEDGKIVVHYIPPGNSKTYNLNAWKRSGHAFVGLGLGLQVAYSKNRAPLVELSYLQFIGPSVPALALQLGYAYGF